MSIIERARQLRAVIESLAETLDDESAAESVELFPIWATDTDYAVGDRRRYEGLLYKCLQAHTAQADWKPSEAVSLWVRVDDPSVEFPAWIQPVGAVDAYPKGAKVSHNEKHWISDVDNNVWEPSVYGWSEV